MFVAIEGSAATGKTSFATAIANACGMLCVLEPDEKELAPLYADISGAPLRVQAYCLARRIDLQRLIKSQRAAGGGVVSDFVLSKDRVYAELFLPEDDLKAYLMLFSALEFLAEPPDLLVFLRASTPILLQRIQRRARDFEAPIDEAFLLRLEQLCERHILSSPHGRFAQMDTSHLDIISRPEHLQRVISELGLSTY